MRDTSKGFHLRDYDDYYDLENIENYNTQKANDLFEEVDSKMMDGTNSTDNQLANKDFVNSSIQHMAANPRGNWPDWSSVPSDPTLYPADADGNKKPSNNDYMVVQDMTGYTNPDEPSRTYEGTWRFTYVGEWDDPVPGGTKGKLGWKPIYQVNEKPLTAAQVEALNSGATAQKISDYSAHIINTNNPHQVTKSQVGLSNVDNTSDLNKPISNLQRIELDKKININQGTANKDKFFAVGSDGNATLVDAPQGGATPEQLATKLDKTNEIHKIEVVDQLPSVRDLYTMYMVVEDEEEWPGLKFTANQNNSTVGYNISGTVNKDIYTSSDGKTWTSWDGSNITLNQGDSIYVWNKTNTLSSTYFKWLSFKMSGSIAASGNVNSMINFSDLSVYCYNRLFSGCTALTQAPDLPATTLADGCYYSMFYGCTALTQAPDLHATTLADGCYYSMFYGCTALTQAPDLPATTLADGCYYSMFYGCTALTQAPDLPATTLADSCYMAMFAGCTSLNSIKLHYTGNFSNDHFNNWVTNVSPSGTLYYNGSDTTRSSSAIPQNWAVQTF